MVFNEVADLDRAGIHRFVLGKDKKPRTLSTAAAADELGDPFATLLLLKGTFPQTAGEVLAALDALGPEADSVRQTQFFLLGEGSQIPFSPDTASIVRNLRFVVARGGGPDGPDILVSAFHPDEGDVELMAWDGKKGGFNYYRTVGSDRAWIFAGNSAHALSDPTQGSGPFESHRSGAFMMKELRFPWINWHSPAAPIQPSVFDEGDPLRTHPWFTQRAQGGALTCETAVARPSITRWAKFRFDALATAGVVDDPGRVMQQVLESPAVNLTTSQTEFANAPNQDVVDLPQTFFIDSEALTEVFGLPAPPPLNVSAAVYLKAIETFEVTFTDGETFRREQTDTHFAFCVPERAFEDREAVSEAIRIGLITDRLAAALLMTDFANPIFSERRAALLEHVPDRATITDGESDFSQAMADTILAAADASPQGSPEREFAERWAVGDDWKAEFGKLLSAYYDAVNRELATQDGFDAYMRLAESRRVRVRGMPITESPLLFAKTNIPDATRAMRSDGSVEEA
jgi:hypothetical protein